MQHCSKQGYYYYCTVHPVYKHMPGPKQKCAYKRYVLITGIGAVGLSCGFNGGPKHWLYMLYWLYSMHGNTCVYQKGKKIN